MMTQWHLTQSFLHSFTLLVGALAISGCGQAVEPRESELPPTTEADVTAVEDVIHEVGAALSAGDGPRWGAAFTDDAVVMRPGEPSTIGRDANIERMQLVFDQNVLQIAFSVEEILIFGDWAFARATYSETVTPKASGEPREIYGKSVNLLKRQVDGSWKIARRMGHRDPSPDEG